MTSVCRIALICERRSDTQEKSTLFLSCFPATPQFAVAAPACVRGGRVRIKQGVVSNLYTKRFNTSRVPRPVPEQSTNSHSRWTYVLHGGDCVAYLLVSFGVIILQIPVGAVESIMCPMDLNRVEQGGIRGGKWTGSE
jgi:hypothetical protein